MSHILTPYLHDLYYAKKHNEQQLWLDNFEADVACVDKINNTLTSSVLGDSLAVDNAFSAITADFGTERLSSILAIHIVLHNWDTSYHAGVQKWAEAYTAGLSADLLSEHSSYTLMIHPTLIAALADWFSRNTSIGNSLDIHTKCPNHLAR